MSNVYQVALKLISKWAQDPQAEAFLKKRLGPPETFENPTFNTLIERGIIPIIAPKKQELSGGRHKFNDSAQLGAGEYSAAYEVSYKGRLAVAKITKHKTDYDAMVKLNDIKNQLGPEDGKHIATVFDHFFDPQTRSYVIIVEKLEPLNPHLKSILYGARREGDKSFPFSQIVSQYDPLDIIHKLHARINSFSTFREMPDNIRNNFLERIDNDFRYSLFNSKTTSDFKSQFRHRTWETYKSIQAAFRDKLTSDQIMAVQNICYDLPITISDFIPFDDVFPNRKVPKNEEYAKYFAQRPETKSFLSFLYRLSEEFHIDWDDLHSANIMTRPGTGDLVISDPGLFY